MPWLQSSTHSASGHRVRASRGPQVVEIGVGNRDAERIDLAHAPILTPSDPRLSPGSARGCANFCRIAICAQFRRDDESMKSYDAGPTDIPILEETIGANFERTVAANPRQRRAR